jgi:hypothetical protein
MATIGARTALGLRTHADSRHTASLPNGGCIAIEHLDPIHR